MSRELDYFPPKGTKWKWGSKALNYSPWTCDLARQKEPDLFLWPASVVIDVDLREGTYRWLVQVTDWSHKRFDFRGQELNPLAACLAAEQRAEAELDKLLPDWVRTALTNGWRPPL